LEGHGDWVRDVAYSPQGGQLASASDDYTVKLWDVKTGECLHTLSGHTSYVYGVMYLPGGDQIFSKDSAVRVWDVQTGDCTFTLASDDCNFNSFVYSPKGNRVAVASSDSTVRVWDVKTGGCRQIFIGHKAQVNCITYSPKGDQIASGGEDRSVRIWDMKAKKCLRNLSGHSGAIRRIVYSSQGDLVVSAGSDMSVRVWDVTSGQSRAVIEDFQGNVNDIAWIKSSGGDYLAAGCGDGLVGMWQVLVKETRCYVPLKWMTTKGELDVKDATIQDVQGLSTLNRKLLKQRGAEGEPDAHRLREAGKKVVTMGSVVSELRTISGRAVESTSFPSNDLVKELEQKLEQKFQQAKDSIVQELRDAVEKNTRGSE
jgi:tricorn protease-like protein